ncbi:MAG: SpoIID/LytB domain-containing protein [Planctomycetota bacterium]|nr:MAG: SpoIID/LytB domain-containing protein [Planctomycetota bacterium]
MSLLYFAVRSLPRQVGGLWCMGLLLLCSLGLLVSSCQQRGSAARSVAPAPVVQPQVLQAPSQAAVVAPPVAPQPQPVPEIRGEPILDVLLARGSRQWLTLERRGSIDGRRIGPGRVLVEERNGQIVIAALGLQRAYEMHIQWSGSGATFSIEGDNRRTEYGGDLVIKRLDDGLAVIERIGIEDFLPGVIEREMGGSWPLEALKAQAVAARSYITSQYLRHHQRPWHVAAAERVDVAYAGYLPQMHVHLRTALRQTRGDILLYQGLPLTAWFHSCSGGRTAAKAEVFADRMAADGVTDPGPAMPSVDDPWARRGAQGLRRPTVYEWQWSMAGDALSWRLRQNAQAQGQQLSLGNIQRIEVRHRHASGRVGELAVHHTGPERIWRVDAARFRLLLGSHDLRSTLWTSLQHQGNQITIHGKGFGHGVGLSQISAWAMAQEGILAGDILRHFYPGARLARRW